MLIWADGFDHYNGTSFATLAGWVFSNAGINTTNPRTGSAQMRVLSSSTQTSVRTCQINFSATTGDSVGFGVAFYIPSYPSINWVEIGRIRGYSFYVSNTGAIRVHAGNSSDTLVGQSAAGVILLGAYQYVEAKITAGTPGQIEVRVQQETVLIINRTITGSATNWQCGKPTGASTPNSGSMPNCDWDDLVIWDSFDNGDGVTDFLGDRRCFTSYPNADTVEADWTPSTGTEGYPMIDESPPSGSDFVEAFNIGDVSEYEKGEIEIASNTIAGVMMFACAAKTDSGVSSFRIGLNSEGNVLNSDEKLPGTSFTYFTQFFGKNPNGNVPWTRTAVNAATARITREQ